MQTALVTGGASYLGLSLIERLGRMGIGVHAVVRRSTKTERLERLAHPPGIHVHDGGPEHLANIVGSAKPDIVFHLAGTYLRDHGPGDIAALIEDNITFGTMLLDAAAANGVSRFVNTASYFEHMDGEGARPVNLYAAAKQAFEAILRYYADAHALDTATLVLFDTYGPGDWRVKLMTAARDALINGTPLPLPKDDLPLDMVHIDDVVEAFVTAAECLEKDPGSVFDGRFAVTSGTVLSFGDVVAAFERAAGRKIDVRPGAYPRRARCVTSLWPGPSLPGWRARIGLDEGVRQLLGEKVGG